MSYKYLLLILCWSLLSCSGAVKQTKKLDSNQQQPLNILMTITVKTPHINLPLQGLVQIISPKEKRVGFILLHGPRLGQCDLIDATAECSVVTKNLSPVLETLGKMMARVFQILGAKGLTAAQIYLQHPALDIYFSDETIHNQDFIIPKNIYAFVENSQMDVDLVIESID